MLYSTHTDHQANYARLIAMARAECEGRLAPRAKEIEENRTKLATAQASLALKPWPRRWLGYMHAFNVSPPRWFGLWFILLGVVLSIDAVPAPFKGMAVAVAVMLTGHAISTGRDNLRRAVRQAETELPVDLPDSECVWHFLRGRVAPVDLALRQAEAMSVLSPPPGAKVITTDANDRYRWNSVPRFAFLFSTKAEKAEAAGPHELLVQTAERRGHEPDIDMAIYGARLYSERQAVLADRIDAVLTQLIDVGRWAWGDGEIAYADFGNAKRLAVVLEVLYLHDRLDCLWRFRQPDEYPRNLRATTSSEEWSAIADCIAMLHAQTVGASTPVAAPDAAPVP